ncbi:serine/threonine protein kinase [Labilithrix luteola]|uniref:non-specific serine/threonine protein kinase n=1 Tax=Labilithrix luteola TaxID=1391654 RepID=A0A0K1QB44_9BACT|nr:serine/threonine protein kinase [Labilithrix luteola]
MEYFASFTPITSFQVGAHSGALSIDGASESGSGDRMEAVRAHIDDCEACRSLVVAYVLLADGGDSEPSDATRMASTVPSDQAVREARTVTNLSAGDVVGDRYVLERVVGEGGMGVVWAAREYASGATFAIKFLKAESTELCRRFDREARIASSLRHPNVLEVRAALSLPDGTPGLVMDLLRGRSLAAELSRRYRLPGEEVVAYFLTLVSAVRAAHALGVVHRDLKPSNVFLATERDGSPPVVMLLDFGLAKLVAVDEAAAEKLTRTGAVLGTPAYMAPEQLFGEPGVDGRADVWAIGAMAYECLAGRRPLEGKSYAQLVRSATRGAIARTADIVPDISPLLASTVDGMLAIDPAARLPLAEVHARLDELHAPS